MVRMDGSHLIIWNEQMEEVTHNKVEDSNSNNNHKSKNNSNNSNINKSLSRNNNKIISNHHNSNSSNNNNNNSSSKTMLISNRKCNSNRTTIIKMRINSNLSNKILDLPLVFLWLMVQLMMAHQTNRLRNGLSARHWVI